MTYKKVMSEITLSQEAQHIETEDKVEHGVKIE